LLRARFQKAANSIPADQHPCSPNTVYFCLPDGVAGSKPIGRKVVVGVGNAGALLVNGDFRLFE